MPGPRRAGQCRCMWGRAQGWWWCLALVACGDPVVDRSDVGPDLLCEPNAGTSGLEICNGVDDDCDGKTDEGPSGGPLRQPCSSQCGGGTQDCVLGVWQSCSAPLPTLETCNGSDDNCDGTTDEGCDCVHGRTRPCGVDTGACRAGIEQCVDGAWSGRCLGAVEPTPTELCNNGVDDNCNDQIDEGCQCVAGESQTCGTDVGECTAGTITCDPNGRWGDCVGQLQAATEVCNGKDDDCDGELDWTSATGFGWRADPFESNDTCASAEGLPNAVDGGAWIAPAVSDPADLTTFPTVHPIGDLDWYRFRAETVSHGACLPGTSQCAFVLVVQLEVSDAAQKDDYRVCLATTSDCNQVNAQTTVCSDLGHWQQEVSSYVLAVKWGGTCGADDSRDVKVRVESRNGAPACGYYQLHARFDYDPTEPCP
jgi:hypothetical protein